MTEPAPIGESKRARIVLFVIAALTLAAWQFPLGRQLLYPFTLLATYAHEMGHGITAFLLGGSFDALEMHLDGSGLAHWHGDVGRIARGLIAAGGLVGPSIAGAVVLILSRKPRYARLVLYAIASFMMISLLFVARSTFAVAFILGCVVLFVLFAQRFAGPFQAFFVQLIGVQLCLSVFRDVSYMFSEGGLVDGVYHLSDSAQIAEALLLPYWVWGAMTAGFSFAVLTAGLYLALRQSPRGLGHPSGHILA
jgi:hypothetical protein